MSAYREAADAPCHQCERPARATCTCCQRPTCDRHRDNRGMCGKCDEAFYRYMKTDDGPAVWFLLPGVMVGAAVLGLTVPALLPAAVATPFLGFPVLLYVRKRQRRTKFFRLMRERGALPEKQKPDVPEEDLALAKYEAASLDRHYTAFEHARDDAEPPDSERVTTKS